MKSTMQDAPLLISDILRYGQTVHGDSTVITVEAGGHRSATFAEVAARAEKLAAALTRLGVEAGDRIGTFCWNNQGHLEAYLAIPCMGAVLHTLNIRLPAEQLAYVINHAEDRVIIVDATVIPLLAAIKDDLKTVETIIVVGGSHVLHLGHHGQPERRGVLAPLDLAAHHGRAVGLVHRHDGAGPDPDHCAHVPRQRLGDAVRRVDGRDRHDHAADVPDG
jgi:acyl-coenzyme A synthetase/AMP-(fatty) acid ligase